MTTRPVQRYNIDKSRGDDHDDDESSGDNLNHNEISGGGESGDDHDER